jgi:hypothetical protein
MIKYFTSYYWKNGKPYGLGVVDPSQVEFSYKIVVDPYYKRFSIERYQRHHFEKMIYDSSLLDFRHLKPADQAAWQRELIQEEPDKIKYLLRNQEDRAILIETLLFENQRCRSCQLHSIHGFFLSTHHLCYTSLQDTFNGVILFDAENRPVLLKTYEIDPLTEEFTTLIQEEWNMQTLPALCLN